MNIEKILQTGETQSIEFKKSLSLMKEGCATLCAMLNTKDWYRNGTFWNISGK
jgi:predicted HTH transcriptional regulator